MPRAWDRSAAGSLGARRPLGRTRWAACLASSAARYFTSCRVPRVRGASVASCEPQPSRQSHECAGGDGILLWRPTVAFESGVADRARTPVAALDRVSRCSVIRKADRPAGRRSAPLACAVDCWCVRDQPVGDGPPVAARSASFVPSNQTVTPAGERTARRRRWNRSPPLSMMTS